MRNRDKDKGKRRSCAGPSGVLLSQEPRQKIIDVDTACQMLQIAMPESEPHVQPFAEFLQAQKEYKAINMDQWTSFLRFTEEVCPSARTSLAC